MVQSHTPHHHDHRSKCDSDGQSCFGLSVFIHEQLGMALGVMTRIPGPLATQAAACLSTWIPRSDPGSPWASPGMMLD